MEREQMRFGINATIIFSTLEMEAELDVAALRANLRTDGRKKEEMRELRFEKDSTYRADGSSTVSHGTFDSCSN